MLQDGEFVGKSGDETIQGVVGKDILARGQQALDLAVLLGHKFDDQMPGEGGEELRNLAQGHIVRNRQVVEQRQGHDDIRRAALYQGAALLVGPADGRRRAGEIDD